MKLNNKLLLIFLIALIVSFFIFLGRWYILKKTPAAAGGAQTLEVYEGKTDAQGAVSVEVTPLKMEPLGQTQFEVSLNTHSVELDDDLSQRAFLYDDKNNVYRPVNWEGSAPGGHHRSGILFFGPVIESAESLELILKDVGGVSLRSFKWSLK